MTGQFGQVERLETRLRQLYADAAGVRAVVDGASADQIVTRGLARRRRTRLTAAGVAAIAVLATVGLALVSLVAVEGPEPAGPDIRGGQVVAPHPYLWWLAPGWHVSRQMGATPFPLTSCADDNPETWGAAKSQVAVYANPQHPDRWFNEFLLQYPDASSAHRALLDGWHRTNDCPAPPRAEDQRDFYHAGSDFTGSFAEGFTWTRRPKNQPPSHRMVARVGNVLVVLEGTALNSESGLLGGTPGLLTQAFEQALPHHYYRG